MFRFSLCVVYMEDLACAYDRAQLFPSHVDSDIRGPAKWWKYVGVQGTHINMYAFINAYEHIHVYIYIHMHIHIRSYTCTYTERNTCMYFNTFICICTCIGACTFEFVHVYVYVCVFV